MTYKALFLDLDNTIFDFDAGEKIALREAFLLHGRTLTEEEVALYHRMNKACWAAYERGELTQEALLVRRFEDFLSAIGQEGDAGEYNLCYRERLSDQAILYPGATDALDTLHASYPLFLITNGVSHTQHKRLDKANLKPYFRDLFISEEIGASKPSEIFFRTALQRSGVSPSDVLVVGDSLSSDIQGAKRSSIDSCMIVPKEIQETLLQGIPAEKVPDYVLSSLTELPGLLKKIQYH